MLLKPYPRLYLSVVEYVKGVLFHLRTRVESVLVRSVVLNETTPYIFWGLSQDVECCLMVTKVD